MIIFAASLIPDSRVLFILLILRLLRLVFSNRCFFCFFFFLAFVFYNGQVSLETTNPIFVVGLLDGFFFLLLYFAVVLLLHLLLVYVFFSFLFGSLFDVITLVRKTINSYLHYSVLLSSIKEEEKYL